MKVKNLLKLVLVLAMGQFLFACNSAKYYKFAAHKPEAYNKPKPKKAPEQEVQAVPTLTEVAVAAAAQKAEAEEAAPVLEASASSTPVVLPKKVTPIATRPVAVTANEAAAPEAKTVVTEREALAMAKEKLAHMSKAERKEVKKELKKALKYQGDASRTSVVEIILAIILPPLAVFLHNGIDTTFWISLILTLLFFIPGIIYALLVVTDTI